MASVEAITYALLNGVVGGRVYPVTRPQGGALPAVVTSVVSIVADSRLSQSTGPQLYKARVQADVFDTSFAGLKTSVDAVRAAVQLKSGTYASKTVVSVTLDLVGPDGVDLETGIYFQSVDFLIVFYE